MYELVGFQYIREEKIDAHGYSISPELKAKGYVQKNNADGYPRWYVMPNKVLILIEKDGRRQKYDIYKNIMILYPERQKMSLKLAQEVIARIINGDIELMLVDGQPFLKVIEKKTKKASKVKKGTKA